MLAAKKIRFGNYSLLNSSHINKIHDNSDLWSAFPPTISNNIKKISYITIATLGDTTEFGDTTVARSYIAGMSSPTRAVFAGGGPGPKDVIDYVTIASTGNALDFGDMTVAKNQVQGTSDVHGGLG